MNDEQVVVKLELGKLLSANYLYTLQNGVVGVVVNEPIDANQAALVPYFVVQYADYRKTPHLVTINGRTLRRYWTQLSLEKYLVVT